MKRNILYILFILNSRLLYSQEFEVQFGNFDPSIKTITAILSQQNDCAIYPIKNFSILHAFFKRNKNILLGLNYSYYKGWTSFSFNPPQNTEFSGYGVGMIELTRFGIKCQYALINIKNRISLSPFLLVDYEAREVQDYGGYIFASINEPNINGNISFEAYNGFQIIPSFGASLKLNLFWKLFLTGNVMYSIGTKPYQKLFFDYSLNNVMQKSAQWQTDGSGFVKSIGLGIKF